MKYNKHYVCVFYGMNNSAIPSNTLDQQRVFYEIISTRFCVRRTNAIPSFNPSNLWKTHSYTNHSLKTPLDPALLLRRKTGGTLGSSRSEAAVVECPITLRLRSVGGSTGNSSS